MRTKIGAISVMLALGIQAYGQSAMGSYNLAQPDMKGTARYMGMAGAFGALGGDLTAISQNPGGIGVYRSSDIGFTLDLDLQSSNTREMALNQGGNWQPFGQKYSINKTKFLLNNIGAVFTLKLSNDVLPNLNFGFTYNKGASFNRTYGGNFNSLQNSMSNYIAYTSEYDEISEPEVWWNDNINPWNPGGDYYAAPWMNILAYQAGIVNPDASPSGGTDWYGLWQEYMNHPGTTGSGSFLMNEQGGTNDFNIVLGGNLYDKLYWGMNFQISNINYRLNSYWSEYLDNALYYSGVSKDLEIGNFNWDYNGAYTMSGTGFSYQLGLIFKPVQALRLGFSFHTPTWYSLKEEFYGQINTHEPGKSFLTMANDGIPGYTNYNMRTPWKILASVAGVVGNKLILSFDYEWANYGKSRFYEPTYYDGSFYDGPYWDWYSATRAGEVRYGYIDYGNPYADINSAISTYYRSTNTFRFGVEFKPINALSIRAGYSHVTSPISKETLDNYWYVDTSSLSPSYRLDQATNYITCGLGYRSGHFYVDLAYVYKHMTSDYHAYTNYPVVSSYDGYSPQSKVSLRNNQIVLSAGYRF